MEKPEEVKCFEGLRFIEEQPISACIKDLRKNGLFVSGERRTWKGGFFTYTSDLTTDQPFLAIESKLFAQSIRLLSRAAGRGLRWSFKESGTNIVCETMYFRGGPFVSRQTARLFHRSQFLSSQQRLLAKGDKLASKLLGSTRKGPARGKVKEATLQHLKQVDAKLLEYRNTIASKAKRKLIRAAALTVDTDRAATG